MRLKTLLFVAAAGSTMMASAQSVNVNVEAAGSLSALPMPGVAITGTINKADFTQLDKISGVTIAKVDLSAVTIAELQAENGITYPANEIPDSAFLTNGYVNQNGVWVNTGNTAMQGIVLPAGITAIGKAAFYNSAATSIDFSACSSLQTIKSEAFDLAAVETLDLSGLTALKTIGDNSLKQTHATSIVLDGCSALETIETYAFAQSYFVTSTSFKGLTALKTIGNRAFLNLGKTSGDCGEIDLTPCSALETIEESAFQSAKTKSVKFPASLKTIETKAFNLASNITAITFEGAVPPTLGATAFTSKIMSSAEVTVPAGSEEAYKALGFENVKTATGVATVRAKAAAGNQPVYDLSGREAAQPANGLYIQGGRVVVK